MKSYACVSTRRQAGRPVYVRLRACVSFFPSGTFYVKRLVFFSLSMSLTVVTKFTLVKSFEYMRVLYGPDRTERLNINYSNKLSMCVCEREKAYIGRQCIKDYTHIHLPRVGRGNSESNRNCLPCWN